jgi:hypothetical protein
MRCPAVVLALCAALPCCGCLYSYTCEEAVRAAEPKRAVHFQSETAARLFCTTVDLRLKSAREELTEEFCVPFISYVKIRKLSEAAFYNDQVAVCDTDGDGVITDAEAVAYHRSCGVQSKTSQLDGVLVQTGYVTVSFAKGPYEVFYPRPYASPPELTFPDADDGQGVDVGRLQQTATGFRAYLTADNWSGLLKWRARGVPAAGGAAAVALGTPAAEAPAVETAAPAKLSAPSDTAATPDP